MAKENSLQIFDEKKVRTYWDNNKGLWYISIIDVIEVLTGTERPRKYWNDLKTKLKKEGSELSEKIGQLKMQSADGKFYNTDIADTEQLFRLIQSIPYLKERFGNAELPAYGPEIGRASCRERVSSPV
mgnify:CR=1 FL=1